MRLKSVILSGFKSFADKTHLSFPGSFCAIVGPNGCGKSNILDAIRWVLGEISPKQLRSEHMSDVIFNGTDQHPARGQASVELIFDNRDHSADTYIGQFSEISIARQLVRDGHSHYLLNGEKCLRRDILNIFLGSGLVHGGYALIDQGMIAKMIDNTPEEMWRYIEEAAGVSKYKERRRETETRITQCQTNMARCNDIRHQLKQQLHQLKKQAGQAHKYKRLKEDESQLHTEYHAIQWFRSDRQRYQLNQRCQKIEKELQETKNKIQTLQHTLDRELGAQKDLRTELETLQAHYYENQAHIAQLKERIASHRQRDTELRHDLSDHERRWQEIRDNYALDRSRLEKWKCEQQQLHTQMKQYRSQVKEYTQQYDKCKIDLHETQSRWRESYGPEGIETQHINQKREEKHYLEGQLAVLRDVLQTTQAHSSLAWVNNQLEKTARSFAECLVVEEGWEKAADAALAMFLDAVCVPDLNPLVRVLPEYSGTVLTIIEHNRQASTESCRDEWQLLADKVKAPPELQPLLRGFYIVNALADAVDTRTHLADGEAFVTPEGIVVSRHWIRCFGQQADAGPLHLRGELQSWKNKQTINQQELGKMNAQWKKEKQHYLKQEKRLQKLLTQRQQQLEDNRQKLQHCETRIQILTAQIQEVTDNHQKLDKQTMELQELHTHFNQAIDKNMRPMSEVQNNLQQYQSKNEEISSAMSAKRSAVDSNEEKTRTIRMAFHEQQNRVEHLRQQLEGKRLERQKFTITCEGLEKKVRDGRIKEIVAQVSDDLATSSEKMELEWAQKIEKNHQQLERVGAINLVALDDHHTIEEKQNQLNQEYSNLKKSLNVLRGAINKIDHQSTQQFHKTLEQINHNMQHYFPKLFKGGHVQLIAREGDELRDGILIKVKLPGKKTHYIGTLSGGERVMVSIALLLSIFAITPAPFCFMDEVDAPLDDFNVHAFGEILSDLSQQVQIICITHNKLTMVKADQLIGIMDDQQGISKQVSVDIEQALSLAS